MNGSVFIRGRFKCAHTGGAYHHDTPAVMPRAVDKRRRFLSHAVVLRVHDVVFHVLRLYGAKSAQPHMQRQPRDCDAHLFNLLEQLGRKMQARCGCSGRALFTRVHRLIARLVVQLFVNIRRQRHFTQRVENLFEYAVERKFHLRHAILFLLLDGGAKVRRKNHCVTNP